MLIVATNVGADHHDNGRGHPERRERVGAALAGLSDAGLNDAIVTLGDRRASRMELERVHRASYLDGLEALCARGGGHLDPDTVASPGSFQTACLAAGAGLAAIDALAQDQGDVAFVAARPPGHHALPDRAMGFCLVNNIAVAAAALAERGERVLIVDWDVHHGNGTQEVFWDDPRVLFVSTHQSPFYPGTGAVHELGGPNARKLTINVPVPAGATGDVLLGALDEVVAPAVESFGPTWVLVSAGFDAHRDDPLAGLRLAGGDFADLARRVAAFAPRAGRLALFLEGGYDLDAVRISVGSSIAALLGGDYRPEPSTSAGPGMSAVDAARRVQLEPMEGDLW
jgi:acetoin utilization deacetylase AcuC-like enzyme